MKVRLCAALVLSFMATLASGPSFGWAPSEVLAGGSEAAAQLPPAATFGEQPTLVLLVNFQDNPAEPYSTAYAQDVVFNGVSSFYDENSYHQVWLSGDVVGWLTIAQSSTVCDTASLATLARQAAANAGVNLGLYRRYVYAFPQNACGFWGYAQNGGSELWINGTFNLTVLAHEMGHNFGLRHSRALHCDDSPVGSVCTSSELGDSYDVMALSLGHFNAYQKERLGWLGYGTSPSIASVTASGTYNIEAYETATRGAKALKILKSADPVTGEKVYYYVECRRALGFDAGVATNATVMNGVLIHTGSDINNYKIDLRDMTVATNYVDDHALTVGKSLTDPDSGVTITLLSVSDAGATISVSLSGAACAAGAPSFRMTTAQPMPVAAGTAVTFTLSLTNNDASSCGGSVFNLQPVMPSGWTASLAASSLSLAPGASGTTTMTVASPAGTAVGSYTVQATAIDGSRTSSAIGTYAVAESLTAKVASSRPSYLRGDTVVLTTSASKGTTSVSGASVNVRVTPPSGRATTLKATTGPTGSVSLQYRLGKTAVRGTYQVTSTVTSAGQTASAETSFVVQ